MIDREDMMELTRRMTVKRTSITRIAGAYMDGDGYVDGTFNTNFLNLSSAEKARNLEIAKEVIFSRTNEKLKEYYFPRSARGLGSVWQLLMGMKSCGLKNDALMDTFYEIIGEHYRAEGDYAILVFHDNYDVPVKTMDHNRAGESEELFEYVICAVCPQVGEYEPGRPVWGFLFPLFSSRSADCERIAVFHGNDRSFPPCIAENVIGCEPDF